MCRIKRLEHILLLHLSGMAFAIYQQLSEEENLDVSQIKQVL